jgi:hypothetical protein
VKQLRAFKAGPGVRHSSDASRLTALSAECIFAAMSTLVEIEAAVAELPPQQQWSLLSWLQARLAGSPGAIQPSAGDQPQWLAEARVLRMQCSTGKPGTPVEELITEIRS